MNLKKLIGGIISLNYPLNYTCDICGVEVFDGTNLCDRCKKTISYNDGITCDICGRKQNVRGICMECKNLAPKYKKAASPLVYTDGAVRLIHKFKEGQGYLKYYFASLIEPECKKFEGADSLTYVPMTPQAEYDRGFNQSKIIAEELAEKLGLTLLVDAVRKVKETPEQKTLNRREREKNLAGCFKANKKVVSGKNIILVDDVLTTGATADEVTTQLLKAGASKVFLATIASVEYLREI